MTENILFAAYYSQTVKSTRKIKNSTDSKVKEAPRQFLRYSY
jgi:hypothetical protein